MIGGRVPVAQISGDLVRIGDRIGEYFVVVAIEGRLVRLEADGREFTLTLDDGP